LFPFGTFYVIPGHSEDGCASSGKYISQISVNVTETADSSDWAALSDET